MSFFKFIPPKQLLVQHCPRFPKLKILESKVGSIEGIGPKNIVAIAGHLGIKGKGDLEGVKHQVIITYNKTCSNGIIDLAAGKPLVFIPKDGHGVIYKWV